LVTTTEALLPAEDCINLVVKPAHSSFKESRSLELKKSHPFVLVVGKKAPAMVVVVVYCCSKRTVPKVLLREAKEAEYREFVYILAPFWWSIK